MAEVSARFTVNFRLAAPERPASAPLRRRHCRSRARWPVVSIGRSRRRPQGRGGRLEALRGPCASSGCDRRRGAATGGTPPSLRAPDPARRAPRPARSTDPGDVARRETTRRTRRPRSGDGCDRGQRRDGRSSRSRSGRQPDAALRATSREHLAATDRLHAGPEAMGPRTADLRGLKGALHRRIRRESWSEKACY